MAVILVVEDEEQTRVLVESILVDDGHQALTAAAPAQALAVFRPTTQSTSSLPTSASGRTWALIQCMRAWSWPNKQSNCAPSSMSST
jgi:CheY-like chemotaxis protein